MTPGARLSAAAEILAEIASAHQPASDILKAWGRAHRYAGSGDRRAIADRVYAALRLYPTHAHLNGQWPALVLASLREDGVPEAEITALCADKHGLGNVPLIAAQAGIHLADAMRDERVLESLFTRAPLDLRINTLKANPDVSELSDFTPTPFARHGLRGPGGFDVTATRAYQSGAVEVQDEAAQIAAALVDAQPGAVVIDYCAGGGGKTLALAADMQNTGRLIACDVDRRRLAAIKPRAARAGAVVEYVQLPHPSSRTVPTASIRDPDAVSTLDRGSAPFGFDRDDTAHGADRVIVDAPCSGSGVWRRRPEDAWRLTQARLDELTTIQAEVLDQAARLLKPGGRLVYVTCSVFEAENAQQAAAFLSRHADVVPLPIAEALDTPALTPDARIRLAQLAAGGHTLTLSPATTNTDGFFVALFQRL